MKVTRKCLEPGIELVTVSTDKFRTGVFSVSLVAPLDRDTATATALVGDVLYRGSEKYPDMEAISAAEDELYGASITPVVRQRGDNQCITLLGSFIDDRYALDGRPVFEPAAELMGELLFRPATEGGVFRRDYVKSEGQNRADQIRALVNDKRGWSIHRLVEVMCRGERYAVDKYGFAEQAQAMEPRQLWERWQALLRQGEVVFYYGGSASAERVEQVVRTYFGPLLTPRSGGRVPCQVVAAPLGAVKEQTDRMDVTQGQLVLGFRTGGIDLHAGDYPALLVCNAMYGGSSSSKLFLNVRERLSLCYYASSMLDKLKGLMVVSSGVAFGNFEVARTEILAQLEQLRTGRFTPRELHAGAQAVAGSLRALLDSQGRMEDFWLTQAVAGLDRTPEELLTQVERVTGEQVAAVARKAALDTVYCLTGREG